MLHAHMHRRASAATTIAIAVFVSFLTAGTSRADAEAGQDRSPNPKALVGSWMETVTFPPETGRPPLKSLGSFHDDGTMECSDQGAVTTEPASVFSSCHGVWAHLTQRTFGYTSRELISDLSGNLVGYLKVRGVYTVSDSGDEYSGTSFAEIVDTGGNVLFSVSVTNTGERIKLDLP